MTLIVTIDGPAAAGKSTAARALAVSLGLPYLDTGSLYRTVAWLCRRHEVDWDDESGCGQVAAGMKIRIPAPGQVVVTSEESAELDISGEIRQPEIDIGSSKVAVHPPVRQALLDLQRRYGEAEGCVVEGRDTGTVIFPEADVKFWLFADPEIRVRRKAGISPEEQGELTDVMMRIMERDMREATRTLAPMMPAEDAIHIDSTHLTSEEVVGLMETVARQKLAEKSEEWNMTEVTVQRPISDHELACFKAGIYVHYKGPLYEADHLTHNASLGGRTEVHYVGLQLDGAKEGPRFATREYRQFLFDRVHRDGSLCEHGAETGCSTKRFSYLGPVFQAWMLDIDPWDPAFNQEPRV